MTRPGSSSTRTPPELARARGIADVRVGRLEQLPWPSATFDLITCLDVIEHIADDRVALAELRRVCKPGGFMLLTVPAYQALWSLHDDANHHYRRYSRRSLSAAVTRRRLVGRPDELVQQRAARPGGGRSGSASDSSAPTTATPTTSTSARDGSTTLLEQPLRFEAGWLRRGGTLPAGLSLLAVLRKPWTDA